MKVYKVKNGVRVAREIAPAAIKTIEKLWKSQGFEMEIEGSVAETEKPKKKEVAEPVEVAEPEKPKGPTMNLSTMSVSEALEFLETVQVEELPYYRGQETNSKNRKSVLGYISNKLRDGNS